MYSSSMRTIQSWSQNQSVKRVLEYPQCPDTQGLIIKPDPENGIKCYIDAKIYVRWNQEKCNNPGLVLSRMGYMIMYKNCPIIWTGQIQTEIVLITMEAEYIMLNQATRDVLPFVIIIKEIKILLKLQCGTWKVLWSIFEKQSKFTKTIKGRSKSQFLHKCNIVPSTSWSNITTSIVLSQMATSKSNMLTPKNRSQIFLRSHYIPSCLDIYYTS